MEKRRCSNAKCEKGAGIFTCNGCQQSFCRKHSEEHRAELTARMDSISQDYDLFRRDMDTDNHPHSLLSRIDAWERESVMRIQQAAEKARRDLREMIGQSKQELKSSMDQLSKEIQSNRESEDYTEDDLTKWIDQLDKYRQDLSRLGDAYLIGDDSEASKILLVKVHNKKHDRSSNPIHLVNARETFSEGNQRITVSKDGLVAVSSGLRAGEHAAVLGTSYYSTGTHYIRFRIEEQWGDLRFGIVSPSTTNHTPIFTSIKDVNNWYSDSILDEGNLFRPFRRGDSFQDGNEVELMIDCQGKEIFLGHNGSTSILPLSVDLQRYPLPWKIIVVFSHQDNRVRILPRS